MSEPIYKTPCPLCTQLCKSVSSVAVVGGGLLVEFCCAACRGAGYYPNPELPAGMFFRQLKMSEAVKPLTFFVAGIPQTQGGMREITTKLGRKALITTGSQNLKPWRNKVTEVAQLAVNLAHWTTVEEGPIGTTFRFFLPMPQSRPAAVRRGAICLASVGYDIDKMTRAIHDSLTDAGVYKNDAQVARSAQVKWEIMPGQLAGAEIIVEALDTAPNEQMLRALERRKLAPR